MRIVPGRFRVFGNFVQDAIRYGALGVTRRAVVYEVPYNWNRSKAMHSEYVEQRNGGYYLAGVRISLDSIVYSFNEGQSPEAIQEDFPLLKRSQIYGAIAFYLDHQAEIDQYLVDTEREFEGNAIPLEQANPTLWAKIERAKAEAALGQQRA